MIKETENAKYYTYTAWVKIEPDGFIQTPLCCLPIKDGKPYIWIKDESQIDKYEKCF